MRNNQDVILGFDAVVSELELPSNRRLANEDADEQRRSSDDRLSATVLESDLSDDEKPEAKELAEADDKPFGSTRGTFPKAEPSKEDPSADLPLNDPPEKRPPPKDGRSMEDV